MYQILFQKSTPDEILIFLFIITIIAIVIILIIREINCWYWKINARLSVQEATLDTLQEILKEIRLLKRSNTESKENTTNSMEINNEKETILNSEPTETIEKMKFF